jgi:DNA invertase Pin-like site-specific DNA recombinase
MKTGKYVAYYRVSTIAQGKSGLGLEAQEAQVMSYLNGGDWKLVDSYTEVESGKNSDREQLKLAFAACRIHGATLLVAKLDRLSRNNHFLSGLQQSNTKFVCCDMPNVNDLTISIMGLMASEEARLISERTKAALQAAKARGVILGKDNLTQDGRILGNEKGNITNQQNADQYASDMKAIIKKINDEGITGLTGISKRLNEMGIKSPRGKSFYPTSVRNLLKRMDK